MAPRRRSAVESLNLQAARAEVRALNIAWSRHITMCARCCFAREDTRRFCETGWLVAKDRARAVSGLRELTERTDCEPVQEWLW